MYGKTDYINKGQHRVNRWMIDLIRHFQEQRTIGDWYMKHIK